MGLNIKEKREVRELSNFDICDFMDRIIGTLGAMELAYEADILPEDYKKLSDTQDKARLLRNWLTYLPEADFDEMAEFIDNPLICELDTIVDRIEGTDGYRVIKCDNIVQEQKLDDFLGTLFE